MLLDDANFPDAVKRGVAAAYANSGQTCSALTRMLVPRTRLAEVEDLARDVAEGYTVGDPFAEGTRLGPLISSVQRDRVRGYIEKGHRGRCDARHRRRGRAGVPRYRLLREADRVLRTSRAT